MKTLIVAIGATFVLFSGSSGTLEKRREIEKRYQTQSSQRIEINGFMGSDIRFISWDKNEVYVKLDVSISSSDEGYENRYIESVSVTDSQTSDALVVKFRELERFSASGSFVVSPSKPSE